MDITERIQAIIGHLEEISNPDNPDLEKIKKQVDLIENETQLKLDEDFNKWINRIDNLCEPDEKVEIIIDQVNNLFVQADELIDIIRGQYDIKDASDEGNHDEYDIVLHEISKSTLVFYKHFLI